MSIKQVINQLSQLDSQVSDWAKGRLPLPDYDEVIKLRLQVASLLYIPLEIVSLDGPVKTSLGSCNKKDIPIPEQTYEKLLLLRGQILGFDQQLSNLQYQLELMMHTPRKVAVH